MQTIDKLLELEDGAAARTSTGNGTGKAIDLSKYKAAAIAFHVSACDSANSDETYVLSVSVSDALAGTYVEVARVTVTRGVTGLYEVAVTGVGVEKLLSNSAYTRVSWTLGGTTPSITFKSYVRPIT